MRAWENRYNGADAKARLVGAERDIGEDHPRVTAHWNNSASNKWNPDPTATVRWGDQSWQEMLTAPLAVIVDRDVDPKTVVVQGGFGPPAAQ